MARTPPWILVAGKQHRIYGKIKRTKLEKTWSKETEEEFKEEEEKELQGSWERRTRRSDLPGQSGLYKMLRGMDREKTWLYELLFNTVTHGPWLLQCVFTAHKEDGIGHVQILWQSNR